MGLTMRQRRAILAILAGLSLACPAMPLAAQDKGGAAAASDDAPLDVTVTGDSAAGWVPPEQLVIQAAALVVDYFEALDTGDYPRAYGMLTADNQKETPAARFREEGHKFSELAGRLRRRRMLASTWTKDPPGAPRRGIYVAFDITAQFTNVDRQCGSLVLYQDSGGGAFKVLRSENYFLDNRTAQQIELSRSHQALVDEWTKISASCPPFAWNPTP
jgi:hypothetical protein